MPGIVTSGFGEYDRRARIGGGNDRSDRCDHGTDKAFVEESFFHIDWCVSRGLWKVSLNYPKAVGLLEIEGAGC